MKLTGIVRCFVILVAAAGPFNTTFGCRQEPQADVDDTGPTPPLDVLRSEIVACQAGSCPDGVSQGGDLADRRVGSDSSDAESDTQGGLCGNEVLPQGATIAEGVISLECDLFTLHVQPVAPGIVRMNYQIGEPQPALPYAIAGFVSAPTEVTWGSDVAHLMVCTPDLTIAIDLPGCRVEVADAENNLLLRDVADGAVELQQVSFQETAYQSRTLVRESPADEVFLGLGEKTGGLDKRGGTYLFWNSDTPGYPTDHDPLYQSIPFYIGLREGRAYGWFLNNTWRSTFDLAASESDRVRITALQGDLDQYVLAGPEIATVLDRYTRLTGRPPMPPRWTLGYHQARWSYYPDSQVLSICQEFRDRAIPADAIWLDIDYMDGFRSFTWDPEGFSDPAALTSDLTSLGFKSVAIIDPGLKSDPDWEIYQQGLAGDHFLTQDGLPFVGQVWPGPSVFPDFTRPETRAWWGSLFPALTEVGVRGVWLDMNEPANFLAEHYHTVPGTVAANGEAGPISMNGVHNTYALAEAMASFDGLLAARPNHRPFLLTRAGFAGIQRYAAVWTGDAASTMESLATSFTMLLGMGLSGLPFVGSDVGGWTGSPSPELFARWLEVGALSPFFRAHVATGTPAQEPWSFGIEVEAISRIHIQERYRLLPYLYSVFRIAHETGMPLLRAMPIEFQEDAATYHLDSQAMLGPFLLVAPVLEAGATKRTFYLPAGEWLEWHSGARYVGPGYATVNLSLQALPTFLRAGAIVPTGPVLQYSDQAPLSPLQLDLFPASEVSSFVLYEDDGETLDHAAGVNARIRYELQTTPTGAQLVAGEREGSFKVPKRPLRLRFRPVDQAVAGVTLDGAPLAPLTALHELDEYDSGYFLDANDRSLWVQLSDQDDFVVKCQYGVAPPDEVDEVAVTLRVAVPPGTPLDSPVYVATSAADWTQQALGWSAEQGVAEGIVVVPRGEWFEYKYTRGSWDNVEKWSGCEEADNRYAFGRAWPVKEDTVQLWADGCQ